MIYPFTFYLATTSSLGTMFCAVFRAFLKSRSQFYVNHSVIIVGSYMLKRIFSLGIIWSMIHIRIRSYFAFDAISPRTVCCLSLSLSRDLENETLYYIITHVGYCDASTTLYFCSSSLYPSVPSNPQFSTLPHCTWDDLTSLYPSESSFAALSDALISQIQWNRNLFLHGSPSTAVSIRSNRLHFVCFAFGADRIDQQQYSALWRSGNGQNLVDLRHRQALRHALFPLFRFLIRRLDRERS